MNAPTYSQATSYPELRTQFLAAAARHGAALHHYPDPLKGMQGEEPFTDIAV